MDRNWLAARLDAGMSYEGIAREAGCSPSKVSWWAKRYGLASSHTDRHAARGSIDRVALEELVARHATVREMAAELGRSPTTVRHWLRRYVLATPTTRRKAQGVAASRHAIDEPTLDCPIHGPTRHVPRGSGSYRCARCRSGYVSERRRRVKQILLDEAGGKCISCGYDRCVAALHFHHVDPETKRFAIGAVGTTLSLEAAREEASKCVVLCANCHAAVGSGDLELPLECATPASMLGSAVLDRG